MKLTDEQLVTLVRTYGPGIVTGSSDPCDDDQINLEALIVSLISSYTELYVPVETSFEAVIDDTMWRLRNRVRADNGF